MAASIPSSVTLGIPEEIRRLTPEEIDFLAEETKITYAFVVVKEYEVQWKIYPDDVRMKLYTIKVPEGFLSDGAGWGMADAVSNLINLDKIIAHDYMYHTHPFPRDEVDSVFTLPWRRWGHAFVGGTKWEAMGRVPVPLLQDFFDGDSDDDAPDPLTWENNLRKSSSRIT